MKELIPMRYLGRLANRKVELNKISIYGGD